MAINNVLALKRENAPRISDPAWISYTGYNYGRWTEPCSQGGCCAGSALIAGNGKEEK
jgi:hypothetical protein